MEKIVRPERGNVTGDWRRLHKEELHGLYSSLNIIWVINKKETEAKRIGAYKVLLGKPKGTRPLGRPKPGWEDNI
jgi:hypothetical protein